MHRQTPVSFSLPFLLPRLLSRMAEIKAELQAAGYDEMGER